MRKILSALLLCASMAPAQAWGPEGHSIVAEIAQRHLTPAAAQQVREILGNASLASVASWADNCAKASCRRYRPTAAMS